jgi:hypothetical protein
MSEKKQPVDLGLLEEDDEFEEFPAEGNRPGPGLLGRADGDSASRWWWRRQRGARAWRGAPAPPGRTWGDTWHSAAGPAAALPHWKTPVKPNPKRGPSLPSVATTSSVVAVRPCFPLPSD